MRIILSGGGTGGHILPNLALYQSLKKKIDRLEVLYLGSAQGMEKELVVKAGLTFKGISCGKLRRYFDWHNLIDPFKTLAGIWQSYWIVRKFKPAIIFSKGGYVTFPVVVAGWLNGVPVLTHESDLVPGLTTKLNAPFCKAVLTSFDKTVKHFKTGKAVFTGSMVREELAEGQKSRALKLTGLTGDKPILLIIGGSLGSTFINEWIWHNLNLLLDKFEIIHLCGTGNDRPKLKKPGYFQQEFAGEEMKDFYAAANLVLCRAGANTLFELAFLGIPAVLIPLVRGSRGDQVDNAEEFSKRYPCLIFDEDQISRMPIGEWMTKVIKTLTPTTSPASRRGNLRSNSRVSVTANDLICELIIKYAKKN